LIGYVPIPFVLTVEVLQFYYSGATRHLTLQPPQAREKIFVDLTRPTPENPVFSSRNSLVRFMRELELVRRELLGSIQRWSSEIPAKTVRPTLECGVLQRCYRLLDEMLAICVARAVAVTGEAGQEACRACAAGKPLTRMNRS
jgi:hypothetical protein